MSAHWPPDFTHQDARNLVTNDPLFVAERLYGVGVEGDDQMTVHRAKRDCPSRVQSYLNPKPLIVLAENELTRNRMETCVHSTVRLWHTIQCTSSLFDAEQGHLGIRTSSLYSTQLDMPITRKTTMRIFLV